MSENNLCLHLPIIYGSSAKPLETATAPQEHTHSWKIYVRSIGNVSLSPFIRRVTFKLHESFNNPVRTLESFPFEVEETGWGEFEIQIKVYLVEPHERPISLTHFLRLYPCPDSFSGASDGSNDVIISEKYDELIFKEPSEALREQLEEFRQQLPALEQAEPLLWAAVEREKEKVREVLHKLRAEIAESS